MISQHLMQLGDDATGKLGGITREFDSSSEKLLRHGEALDRAAEIRAQRHRACCSKTCRAPSRPRASWPSNCAPLGSEFGAARRPSSASRSASSPSGRARPTRSSPKRPTGWPRGWPRSKAPAPRQPRRVGEAEAGLSGALDALLDRTSATLEEIRTGIDVQASGRRGAGRASLGRHRQGRRRGRGSARDQSSTMPTRRSRPVGPGRRAGPRLAAMIAEIDRGLALIDQRFTELASNGDERANHFLESLDPRARRARCAGGAGQCRRTRRIGSLAERTTTLRESIDRLTAESATASDRRSAKPRRRRPAGRSGERLRPDIDWIRDAAVEASEQLSATGSADRRAAGALRGAARRRRRRRRRCPVASSPSWPRCSPRSNARRRASAPRPARRWSPRWSRSRKPPRTPPSGPARRSKRSSRKAPASCRRRLGEALERVIRESVEERLRDVETVAARAVEAARAASDRLTQQMLTLGQSAVALERISNRPARTSARRTARRSPAASRC